MTLRKAISFLVLPAILLVAAGDCLTPLLNAQALSKQEADCCASGHCSPSATEHPDCCKTMPSDNVQQYVAKSSISIEAPAAVAFVTAYAVVATELSAHIPYELDATQNGPPDDLYTIHHSFLI